MNINGARTCEAGDFPQFQNDHSATTACSGAELMENSGLLRKKSSIVSHTAI